MKKGKKVASVLLLSLAVLLVGLTDMACGVTPITIPLNIPLGDIVNMSNLPAGSMAAGLPIPAALSSLDIEICDLPSLSMTDINDLLVEEAGEFVAGLLTSRLALDSITLDSITLTASEGDFDSLTLMALSWIPAVGATTDLGTEADASGLGTEILLAPDPPADLLALLQAASDSGGCATLRFRVEGTIPATWPVFSTTVAGTVTLNVSGLIMPMILETLLNSFDISGALDDLMS